ncbi:hypothetical protein [Curtobacterium sp. MEB011]|uniref:hypothetical protein n=1 Tax=Curtobacterium sp. MEB011 TaxID=3040285 RepID=UPI00254B9BE4|nr:hypothetical protein [Curtobacterium sp. MEB011]
MGWLRRHVLHGGRYDERDRRDQLRRYVVRGDRLVAFLTGHGDPSAARVRARVDHARELLEHGWSRDDLLTVAAPVWAPWPSSKGRDAGAPAPEDADRADGLIADLNAVALELRAVAEV